MRTKISVSVPKQIKGQLVNNIFQSVFFFLITLILFLSLSLRAHSLERFLIWAVFWRNINRSMIDTHCIPVIPENFDAQWGSRNCTKYTRWAPSANRNRNSRQDLRRCDASEDNDCVAFGSSHDRRTHFPNRFLPLFPVHNIDRNCWIIFCCECAVRNCDMAVFILV